MRITIVRYKILFFNLPAAGRRKGAKMQSRQEKLEVFLFAFFADIFEILYITKLLCLAFFAFNLKKYI